MVKVTHCQGCYNWGNVYTKLAKPQVTNACVLQWQDQPYYLLCSACRLSFIGNELVFYPQGFAQVFNTNPV